MSAAGGVLKLKGLNRYPVLENIYMENTFGGAGRSKCLREGTLLVGHRPMKLLTGVFLVLEDISPFVGPLIPLFWISGDISSGF